MTTKFSSTCFVSLPSTRSGSTWNTRSYSRARCARLQTTARKRKPKTKSNTNSKTRSSRFLGKRSHTLLKVSNISKYSTASPWNQVEQQEVNLRKESISRRKRPPKSRKQSDSFKRPSRIFRPP
jgi:hypothetical protein